MATDMKRIMLSLPKDLEAEVDEIKRGKFYGQSYAEMYRQLISLGIAQIKNCDVKNELSA
ncbi:hypothetical protein SDC9_169926 [bioreactor metagenome]|uniref:CopG family transcriptional regulator n=1 Tax=bioreactor metagenome TaxID=1076179 RepID=A0A645GFJ5_9ZZZZ